MVLRGITPMKYTIIIEKGASNYSAYIPDLPGCVTTGSTIDETMQNMKEAIDFHIEGLLLEGLPVPPPSTITETIEPSFSFPTL
jgi:predicted RNase H-like HicB family nuclease